MAELRMWTPENPTPREDYLKVEEHSLKSPEFRQVIRERTRRFADTITEKWQDSDQVPSTTTETGQAIGQAVADLLQMYSLKDSPDQISQLKRILIQAAPNPDQAKMIISGAMAQFGVMETFKEFIRAEEENSIHLTLYPALPEEDLRGGTDFWIHTSSDIAYSVQVKVVKNYRPELNNEFVYPISIFEDVYEQLLDTDLPELFIKNTESMSEEDLRIQLNKCIVSLQNQAKLARKYDNVIPLLITIPSPYSDRTVINPETGEPHRGFGDTVYQKFYDINDNAEEYLQDPTAGYAVAA